MPVVACVTNSPGTASNPAAPNDVKQPDQNRTSQTSAGSTSLDFDFRARFFELLLDGRGFVLGNAFLHGLWRAINQVLGFLQAQAGDFPNSLDDVYLVAAN